MFAVGAILGVLILPFQNSNACEKRDGICCLNYFRKGNLCKECPAGTFGVNCSGKCVKGYYGRFCKEACNCSSHICDRVNGCLKNNTIVSTYTVPTPSERCRNGIFCEETCNCSDGFCDFGCFQGLQESTQSTTTHVKPLPTDDIKWQKILFTLMGFILVVLVAALVLYYNSNARKKKRSQVESFQETVLDSHAESVEHNDQTLSMVTIHTSSRTDTDRDTNIYADIRSSQMMQSPSYFSPKRNNLSIQKEEEGMVLALLYDDDCRHDLSVQSFARSRSREDEILKDDKQLNDYGIFEESCQYSVLSLRRNFNPFEMECHVIKQSLRRQFSNNNDDRYCVTNVWFSEDNRSQLDDYESDTDVSLSSKHFEDASQKSDVK